MNPTLIETHPHHIHLWTSTLVLQIFLHRPSSYDNQNTVVVVATTVMSCAALRSTLVLGLARSLIAMAIDITEVHIIHNSQDAWPWRTCTPGLSLCQVDLRFASQLDHNHPIFSAAMWQKRQNCLKCRCSAVSDL